MDLEIIILSDMSQKEKGEFHMISHICGHIYDTNELIHKTEADSKKYRTDLWLPRKGRLREGQSGIGWEFVISR